MASGYPRTGSRPVQFGIAVSRKPATAAITKPNSAPSPARVFFDRGVRPALAVALYPAFGGDDVAWPW